MYRWVMWQFYVFIYGLLFTLVKYTERYLNSIRFLSIVEFMNTSLWISTIYVTAADPRVHEKQAFIDSTFAIDGKHTS